MESYVKETGDGYMHSFGRVCAGKYVFRQDILSEERY